ncbi:MAG: hypothetical protein V3S41_05370 [Spirochaetia bacterium]
MRFSILTLDLALFPGQGQAAELKPLARFIAENNVSCVCLQGCAQHRLSPLLVESDRIREDNAVTIVADQLGRLGLKYNYVWDWAHYGETYYESGSAVLTQLPILGSAARFVSEIEDRNNLFTRQIVAARLGVSPDVNIDVYSVALSGAGETLSKQVNRLLMFVGESPDLFVPKPQPAPRRRGRPPRALPSDKRSEPVRMVFLAGKFADLPEGRVADSLQPTGFGRGDAGATADAGPWADAVYLRPGLRPTDGERVFAGSDGPVLGGRSGLLLGFEV